MSEPWMHCEHCGYWVPASENNRCAGHHREYAPYTWYCTTCKASFPNTASLSLHICPAPVVPRMSFAETLKKSPELMDAFLDELNDAALMYDGYVYGLPLANAEQLEVFRALILAWVVQVEETAAADQVNLEGETVVKQHCDLCGSRAQNAVTSIDLKIRTNPPHGTYRNLHLCRPCETYFLEQLMNASIAAEKAATQPEGERT